MRCCGLTLIVALMLSHSGARELPRQEFDDLGAMQGLWSVVTVHRQGEQELFERYDLRFDGDRLTLDAEVNGAVIHEVRTIRLDPTADPKQIDIIEAATDSSEEQLFRGIYRFEGGRLVRAMGMPGDERPTSFIQTGDDAAALYTVHEKARRGE